LRSGCSRIASDCPGQRPFSSNARLSCFGIQWEWQTCRVLPDCRTVLQVSGAAAR
jgi:hypothetical protein